MRKLVWALMLMAGLAGSLAVAQPKFFWNHPAAQPLTGTEIIGPVRQGLGDVTLTLNAVRSWVLANVTLGGGLRFTGDQSLAVTPRSSPLASRASVWRTATSVNTGLQQFFFGSECISQNAASSLGGNVCESSYILGTGGSGGVWSRTDVNELDASFPFAASSSIVHEVDTNNLAVDRGDFGVANNVGILVNGLGKRNTAAISIQTGNPSLVPIWYHGIQFGSNSVYQYTITDRSNAGTTLQVEGSHNIGVDLAGATITGAGIRLGAGFSQGIYVRNAQSTFNVISTDPAGQPYIGSPLLGNVFFNGNVSPSSNNLYTLGSPAQRWTSGYVNNVNVATGDTHGITATPASGSTAYTLLYSDAAGQAVLGSVSLANTYAAGNFIPTVNAAFSLGSTGQRWTNAWLNNVNGIPATAAATPASSAAACVAGQLAMDASFAYFCVATNSWRRAALSTF